jgi:hypothetical protein
MTRSLALALTLAGAVAVSVAAPAATAQSRVATGAIQVERALTLSNVQSMSFLATRRNIAGAEAAAIDETTGPSSAPAVIDVTGDPGRVYRIQLPETIRADIADSVINGFQVWSETMGDVSETMAGRLNSEGHDRLRISGVLTTTRGVVLTDVSAAVPVSIDYE